jgi:putative hemolysin
VAQMATYHPAESQMVEQVFRMGDLRVGAIMTPRTELVWLDINEPQESIQQKIVTTGYSRYPVADGKLDNVIGMVRTKEVLVHCLTDSPFNLQGCLRPPLFVPETMALLCALEKMRSTGVHTALVIDEYGGLMGMITLNTLLQEIIRNDLEPSQLAESLIVRREDGSWLMDGLLPTDRFKATLKVDTLPLEDTGAYKYAWRICHDAN